MVVPKLLGPITPGKGKFGKALVATAVGAVAVTTIADAVARRGANGPPTRPSPRSRRDRRRATRSVARRVAQVRRGGGASSPAGSRSRPRCRRRVDARRACGAAASCATSAPARSRSSARRSAWDFIYYWNHRFMHESRYMWAIHVVHHSSERYNLSTALRQPVADALGTFVPVQRAVRCSASGPS